MKNRMEIDYINGARTVELFGVAKYQREIHRRLKLKLNIIEYDPVEFKIGNANIANALKLYFIYPLMVKKRLKKGNLKHITSQNLAYLQKLLRLKNCLITCYDLIPLVYEKSYSSILNMKGLKNAERIITISQFSKNDIIQHVGYPENRIDIVYPAVDHEVYTRTDDKEILKDLNLSQNSKIVLYIGSEHPRQNVPTLIKSFYKLKKRFSDVKLVKIGRPQFYGAREKNLKLIEDLNLNNDIIFIDYVPEGDLPRWYNASDLLVYPCSYAGFGLPPLEAMACGTPVITSNTTSLPEVVGDAGIMMDPHDVDLMADKMYEILVNDGLRDDLIKKGLKRAMMFSWDKAANETFEIYKYVLDNEQF